MALGDIDNDGDVDVIVNNLNSQPELYQPGRQPAPPAMASDLSDTVKQ
jgi:hypothetical protein